MPMKRWPLDTTGPFLEQTILLDDSKVQGDVPDPEYVVTYQFPQPDPKTAQETLAQFQARAQAYRQQCVAEATALARVEAQRRAQAARQERRLNDAGVTSVAL